MYVYTYASTHLRVLAFVCTSAQKMAGDEEYYLQIDSHMRFMQDWDEVMSLFSYVEHDSFICGTWLIHTWDIAHFYKNVDEVTWLIHM